MGFPQMPPDPMGPPGMPMGPPPMAPPGMPMGPVGAPQVKRGTGITTGVLAVVGGVFWLGMTILMWVILSEDFDMIALIVSFALLLLAIVLLVGGILTFFRNRVGTLLVVIGCGVVIAGWVVGMGFGIFFSAKEHFHDILGSSAGERIFGFAVWTVLALIPAILTMYMARCAATKRWVASKPRKTMPPQYGAYGQQSW